MIIRKAYQYKLKTTSDLGMKLSQMAGCCRFVWNKALALNLDRLKSKQNLMWYHELAFWLTFWKKTDELSFLKDCPSQALQQTLKHLDRAFRDAFDKNQTMKKLPVFKRKFCSDRLTFPQGFKFDNRKVFLPKLGWVSFYKSRDIEGTPKNVTVKRCADGWYISVQVEIKDPVRSGGECIGIDLGIKRFATLSTGQYFSPQNNFRKHEKRLAKQQRKLARQKKHSNKWKKQKHKIAKTHQKIRCCRLDHIHWVTSKISKKHAIVVMENLSVKNMSKSAKGSVESPGKNVNAKSGLNKAILDQGWGEFKAILSYKQAWSGGQLICVDPKYTSQTCPECRNVDLKNRLSQSRFLCNDCGYKENADIVGSKNVLAAGLAVIACQANSAGNRQQEPVRNRKEVLLQVT